MSSKVSCKIALLLFAGMLAVFSVANVTAQKQPSEKYVQGELLVKFIGGAESNTAKRANMAMNATVLETLGDLGWQRVRLPESLSVDVAMSRYSKLDGVEYAQPNFYYHLLLTPNDPSFTATGMYGLTRIAAPSAWDLTTGSSNVVVADIDTGLGYTHQDIAANAWVNAAEIQGNGVDDDGNGFVDDIYGLDVFNNDSNPIDDNPSTVWHGTHTAGTIGAVGNNGIGVVGVNWNVRIMSIKLYGTTGNGANSTSAMLVNAYNYVRMMKNRGVNIRVTNNSYGGCGEACGFDQATKDALDAMGNAGILNVFAAGNDNINNDVTPSYPVSYTSPSVLGVAASTSTDAKASFSSYGPISVDLAAPGSGVLSTTFASTSSYGSLSGTSMASPHTAGAAALLSAFNPNLSVASLKATLMNTVDPIAAWSGLIKTGGRLNVDRALRNQTACTFPTAMTLPTKGGIFTLNLTPGTNCDYFVRSTSNWIKITGGSNQQFSGNGTVTFSVTVNPTITRVGTIKFGEQSLTITQSRN
jgi:subtilisin family serine protease